MLPETLDVSRTHLVEQVQGPVHLQHVRHVLDRVEQEGVEVVRCHVQDAVCHYPLVQELRNLALYGDMK